MGQGLLRVSWHKWLNIAEDYGRELYLPWRITCGQVLYKDMASLFGPLPPYWNALLFKIFGTSIMTLVQFNVLLLAGLTALVYKFFKEHGGHRAALYACVVFLGLLAFRQGIPYWDQGNFAYLCPYTYSVTYALFLSYWAFDVFGAYVRSGQSVLLGALGFLIGLTALCRFEIFMALSFSLLLGLMVLAWTEGWTKARTAKALLWVSAGFLMPLGAAFFYFAFQIPLPQVLPSIFGANGRWQEIFSNGYYQYMAGFNDPWHNMAVMFKMSGFWSLGLICVLCFGKGQMFLCKSSRRWAGVPMVLAAAAGLAWIVFFKMRLLFGDLFRCLPLALVLILGYYSWVLWLHRRAAGEIRRLLPLWAMALWALLMLFKVLLRVQISTEGFVYAMPAVMMITGVLQGPFVSYLQRVFPGARLMPVLCGLMILAMVYIGLEATLSLYQFRFYRVRTGPDTIVCNTVSDPVIKGLTQFLKVSDKIMGPRANFLAFPDGLMMNFLTRRPSPSPYLIFKSSEISAYGQEALLKSVQGSRPDYVLLVQRQWPLTVHTSQSLYPFKIRDWILSHYQRVWPAENSEVMLLKRLPLEEGP